LTGTSSAGFTRPLRTAGDVPGNGAWSKHTILDRVEYVTICLIRYNSTNNFQIALAAYTLTAYAQKQEVFVLKYVLQHGAKFLIHSLLTDFFEAE
jgi:hypothetical protein